MNQNFHPAIICLGIETIKQYCASCIKALLATSLIYSHVSMVYIFCTVIGYCSHEILKMYFSQKSIVFLGFFGYSTGECQRAINTAVFQNRFAIHGYVYRMRFSPNLLVQSLLVSEHLAPEIIETNHKF